MKIKTTELEGDALDWAVATCEFSGSEGWDGTLDGVHSVSDMGGKAFSPSTNWDQGGSIIEWEWLDVTPWPNESDENLRWQCKQHDSIDCVAFGPKPLIAAMRCYVASKLGNEVDVPDELIEYEDPNDYVRMGWVDSRGRP